MRHPRAYSLADHGQSTALGRAADRHARGYSSRHNWETCSHEVGNSSADRFLPWAAPPGKSGIAKLTDEKLADKCSPKAKCERRQAAISDRLPPTPATPPLSIADTSSQVGL